MWSGQGDSCSVCLQMFLLKYHRHTEKGTNDKCRAQCIFTKCLHPCNHMTDTEHFQHPSRLPPATLLVIYSSPREPLFLPPMINFACCCALSTWNRSIETLLYLATFTPHMRLFHVVALAGLKSFSSLCSISLEGT